MAELVRWAGVYGSLVAASLRGQMEYRGSFLLELLGRLLITGIELFALAFLFLHIDSIGGWTRWQVIYLYAVANVALGLGEALTAGLDEMPELVRTGRFEFYLVRPLPALLLLLGRDVQLRLLGRALQGAAALAFALWNLDLSLGPAEVALLLGSILAGTLVYAGLFVGGAAQCFWTVESTEMFNAFTYGGAQFTQFPLGVYPGWMQWIFLYVVPVGFVAYLPAVAVLGAPDPLGLGAWAAWLTPLVTLLFLSVALLFWRWGIRRYESGGG